ncbi:tRNA-dihydrouridine synthase family protein [Candidatus Hodarchaeum mangrovi]
MILGLKNPFFLSPLANITIPPFRRLCAEIGADVTVSEMTFARGLILNQLKSLNRIQKSKHEKKFGIQLLTNNVKELIDSINIIEEQKLADFIELNLGCPKRKITNANLGAALLIPKNSRLLLNLLETGGSTTTIPFSIKMRLGFSEKTYLNILKHAEKNNIAFATLHARLAIDSYKIPINVANWNEAVQKITIPIIANGDIPNKEIGLKILENSKISGIAIGRAARGNPKVFNKNFPLSLAAQYKILIQYMKDSNFFSPLYVKIQSNDFLKKFRYSSYLRNKITSMQNLEDIVSTTREALEAYG